MASSGSGMKYRKKPVVVVAEQFDPERWPWPDGVEPGGMMSLYTNNEMTRRYRWGSWVIRTAKGYTVVREGDWIVTGVKGEKYTVSDDIFRATYEPVADEPEEKWADLVTGDPFARITEAARQVRATYEPVADEAEPWIEEIARPLVFDKVTHCPFCRTGYGPVLARMGKLCEHYRRNVEIAGDDRIFAVFEGTPSCTWNTYLWMDDHYGGPVRIVGGGPEWFEVQTAGGISRLARRRDLVRIPYVDGIVLSSKNDPLGEDKAAGGVLADIVEEARQVRAAEEQERIRTGDDMAKLTPEREAEICEKFGIRMETVNVSVDNPSAAVSWRGMDMGRARPVAELWDGIEGLDDEAIPEVTIVIDRRREDDKLLHRTILTGGIRDILPRSLTTTDDDLVVGSMGPDKTRKLLKWLRKKGLV